MPVNSGWTSTLAPSPRCTGVSSSDGILSPPFKRPSDRRAFGAEPGAVLDTEQRTDLLDHLRMIGVEPGALAIAEQARHDQVALDRGEGERLEAEHPEVAAGDVARLDKHQILDADAVFAGLVIARLVREEHAGAQRL